MERNSLVVLVSLIVGLPLFVYTMLLADGSALLSALFSVNLGGLAGYLALSVANIIAYTMIWQWFLACSDRRVSFLELFQGRMAGFALSYVTPGPRIGGEITRGSVVNVDTKTGVVTSAMEKVVLFLSGLVFDTAAVLLAVLILPSSPVIKGILAVLLFTILAVGLAWFVLKRTDVVSFLTTRLESMLTGIEDYADDVAAELAFYVDDHREAFLKAAGLGLLTKVSIALQLYVLTGALGAQTTFVEAVFLAAATDLAYTVPSYMGLGALEAGHAGMFALLGKPKSTGVLLAFITRARDILFSAYGLLVLSEQGRRKI